MPNTDRGMLYDRREYERARVEFLRVINEHPNGNKVPDAMVKVAFVSKDLAGLLKPDGCTTYDADLS